ncbi:MAG TPA: sulfotransferase, partial [Phototrophicaceae bacterium]|nr:sulfotransferase [Phototrophicaceae bacterium]
MADNLSTPASALTVEGRRPVFVVGHPRSGTTLVQLLITAHPVFSSAPETHFFTHVLGAVPDWLNRTIRPDELHQVFKRLIGKPGIELDNATLAQITEQAKNNNGIAPAVLLNTIMEFYAAQQHKHRRWLEKTPRHVNYIPQILTLFPDARIINIVRDPRDVVSSNVRFQKLSPEKDSAERRRICVERSQSWNQMVRYAQRLLPNEPRLFTVRYEDLIIDTVGSLTRLM